MYAVIATGGKQYKVQAEDIIDIELLGQEEGTVSFDQVLAIHNGTELKLGTPIVVGAKVEGEIVETFRGDKLIVFKMKRRKGYRRKKGHRQNLVKVRISSIVAG